MDILNYEQLYDKTDENEHLIMYHFKHGVDYEPDVPLVKGLVIDKNSNSIICNTSIYSNEYDVELDKDTIPDIDWPSAVILTAEEGCLLRVYCHNNEWYISTHRKFDASTSRWGCKYSFKSLFVWALQEYLDMDEHFDINLHFFDKLDKDLVYTFLLRNNNTNRIVCDSPSYNEAKLYFSGYYHKDSTIPLFTHYDKQHPLYNVPFITLHKFLNRDEVLNYVNKMSYKHHQGLLVFSNTGDKLVVFKILCPMYFKLKHVRDNCSDLIFRYAQLRLNQDDSHDLKLLFPSFSHDFMAFENTLNKLSYHIATQYINRFVKKQYAAVTPLQYKITKKLREWYLQNPVTNRVTSLVVSQFINNESPVYVYKLVNEI